MAQIEKNMTIANVLKEFPQVVPILANKLGLKCGGCSVANVETLEEGLLGHGMVQNQVDNFIKELNDTISGKLETENGVELTIRAAKKFKEILKEENKEGWALRVSEKAGGCKGVRYVLSFSEKAKEGDFSFNSQGVEVHVEIKRAFNISIDYSDGLNGSGFKIVNANTKSSCKCGSSHSY